MMLRPLRLEAFDPAPDLDEPVIRQQDLDARVQDAHDAGYAAGWQDALTQVSDERAQREADALGALQSVHFTYHEALSQIEDAALDTLRQILNQVLGPILPDVALAQLDMHLRTAFRDAGPPIVIACAPDMTQRVTDLCNRINGLNARVQPEPGYCDAQIALRLGAQERVFDPAALRDLLADEVGRLRDSGPAAAIDPTPVTEARHAR